MDDDVINSVPEGGFKERQWCTVVKFCLLNKDNSLQPQENPCSNLWGLPPTPWREILTTTPNFKLIRMRRSARSSVFRHEENDELKPSEQREHHGSNL